MVVSNQFIFQGGEDSNEGPEEMRASDFEKEKILHCMNKSTFIKQHA